VGGGGGGGKKKTGKSGSHLLRCRKKSILRFDRGKTPTVPPDLISAPQVGMEDWGVEKKVLILARTKGRKCSRADLANGAFYLSAG